MTETNWYRINQEFYSRRDWPKRNPNNFLEQNYIQFVAKSLGLAPNKKLLDVGCGDGFYLQLLNFYCDAYGIDFAEPHIYHMLPESIRKKIFIGNLLFLPFDDNVFDFIFFNHAIEHIPVSDISTVLSEIKRILVPGGRAFIATPNRYGLSELFLDVTFQTKRRINSGHANIMPHRKAIKIIKNCGFEILFSGSQSILNFPGGLEIPWIGKYISLYPVFAVISKIVKWSVPYFINLDRRITSSSPFKLIGHDIIIICQKLND